MPIKFDCPSCQKKLSVSEAMAGKRGKCPGCQNPILVPLVGNESSTGQPSLPRPLGASNPRPVAKPGSSGTNGLGNRTNGTPPPTKATAPGMPPPLPPKERDAEEEAAAALADVTAGEATEIEFECDFCSTPIKLTVDQAGKRIPCPECRRIIKVPEPRKVKKDWRQNDDGLPSGARLPNQPVPEGSWGGSTTTRASREALEEAGALPTYSRPVTIPQRILQVMGMALLLGLVGWGGLSGYRWWTGLGEKAALQAALKYAGSVAKQEVAVGQAAALHLGASAYYRPVDAAEAAKQCGNGYGLLASDKQATMERDLLLIDLALTPLDLAGSKEEMEAGRKISWDDAQKQTVAALKAIQSREARLEGLIQVVNRLKEKNEVRRVIPVASRAFDLPAEQAEALARICLTLTSLGVPEEAAKAGTQALQLYESKSPPKVTASVLAVADVLKKKPPKMEKESVNDDTLSLGKCEGLARSGDLDGARKEVENLALPHLHLQGLNTIVAVGLESNKANPADLETAVKYAGSNRVRNQPNARWQLYNLVDLGRRGNLDETRLAELALGIADPALQGRAQLDLLQDKLSKLTTVAPADLLETVNADSVSNLRAHQALAAHNTRLDSSWSRTMQSWQPAAKAFGQLGQALGMQRP